MRRGVFGGTHGLEEWAADSRERQLQIQREQTAEGRDGVDSRKGEVLTLEEIQDRLGASEHIVRMLDLMHSPGRKAHRKGVSMDALSGGRTPIRLGMEHAFRPQCSPMDEQWKAHLKAAPGMSWYSGHAEFKTSYEMAGGRMAPPEIWALRDGLVAMGGEEVCLPGNEPDLDKIIARGQLWGRSDLVVSGGEASHCHSNSAFLWESAQDRMALATGYALSDDGVWRQHTWCIEPTATSARTVETTERRELYFGFVMTLAETLRFAAAELDEVVLRKGTAIRYGHAEVVERERARVG